MVSTRSRTSASHPCTGRSRTSASSWKSCSSSSKSGAPKGAPASRGRTERLMRQDDARFMARAVALARRGLGRTSPNPPVGAVVVRGGRIVGEGWHRRAGGPHAEVVALRRAGAAARGATVYVTLEPCSHFGRTPPCADALIEAGVARVVAASEDSNPRVAGGGFAKLREAGITVESGLMCAAARELNRGFFSRIE